MKKLIPLLLLFCGVNLSHAQNKVVLTKPVTTHLINRNIYGHFAEHLGRCIYGGFYVGEGNKKIPNKNGIRTDVVEAMKK